MRERYVDPASADLDAELGFIRSQTKQSRRVQMQRGESWLVRFLPARMGPKKHWYARIAKHWVNQKPIVCPRTTGPDYGGDPDAYCPVCAMVDELDAGENDAVRDAAFRSRANPQWMTYCLVIEKSSGHGSLVMPDAEVVLPYAFDLYRNTFEELSAFYRNNAKKANPMSVLDYMLGCDFWASKTAKGIRLDKQDPQPIFDDLEDPINDPRIIKIESLLHSPRIQIPGDDKLEEMAEKLHEFATKGSVREGGRGGGSRRGSRPPAYEEPEGSYDEDERAARPRRGGRTPRQEDEYDDVPGAEYPPQPAQRPAQRSAPSARHARPDDPPESEPEPERETQRRGTRPPAREEPPAADPDPGQDDPETGDEGAGGEESYDDGAAAETTQRPAPRSAPAAARPARAVPGSPSERPAAAPRPAQRPPAAQAAARAARPAARPESEARVDEGEEVPEERDDRAPAARQPLREEGEEATPPPPVNRQGGTASREQVRARVEAASRRRP